ncbi:MAG TPA: hypothetical protein VEU94_18390 [Terriglobales bacterium]|nr:hypothetical protein [Terriglobales bacterium]
MDSQLCRLAVCETQAVRKDHITDWITANTAKGLHLQSYVLEPVEGQATENLVAVHYW